MKEICIKQRESLVTYNGLWERGGMADAADLKSAAARREGSSPSAPTRFENWKEDNGTIGKGFPSGARTDEVEFRQENVPVARFQEFARPSLRGRDRISRSESQSPSAPTNWFCIARVEAFCFC